MWKLIIKNLWNRRHKNGWLLGELVLVSIVTWVIADPVIVLIHDKALPLGYDADRLCMVDIATLEEMAPQFDKQATDSASMVDDFIRIQQRIREREEVEEVTPIITHAYINSHGSSTSSLQKDSSSVGIHMMNYPRGQHFFETYGMKATSESPTIKELSEKVLGPKDIIVTQNLIDFFFKDGHGVGKQIYSINDADTTFYHIVGAVENIKVYSTWRPSPVVFRMQNRINPYNISDGHILIRLKKDVSMDKFMHDFRPWMIKNLKSGNLFVRSLQSYQDIITEGEYSSGVTNKIRISIALAIFFMISLCLGVIGTFWLQTRKRREEIGILLSFGGHPSYIIRMLLGEGWILSTLAFVIGCLVYLQYALKEGLYAGVCWTTPDDGYWVSSFSSHFIGVSLIVYLLILLIVSIGIYIPARKISKINPVDALHDE